MKEQIVKPCKRCGALMQIKVNRATGEEFLGCTAHIPGDWDSCSYTELLPETIRLRRAGVKDMFEDEV